MKNNFQQTTLDNGMMVVTDSFDNVESVSMGIWCKTGARIEDAKNNGIAHFLEHMVFKGTKSRSALEIVETIENVGGRLNAYTGREMTAYYARVLKEDIDLAFDLVSDILLNPAFEPEEMEKERGVILQEIAMYRDSPDDHAFDNFTEAAYGNSPLGWSILGTSENVSRFTADDIVQFMGNYYKPGNLILAASGNISHDELVKKAEERFSSLENGPITSPVPSKFQGGEIRVERDLEQLHVFIGFESPKIQSSKNITAKVLTRILSGGMASRLFQEIRENRGLAYAIRGYNYALQDTGYITFYTGTDPDKAADLMPAMVDVFAEISETVKDDEIDRAKSQLRALSLMSLESTPGRCDRLAKTLINYGEAIEIGKLLDKIDQVTKEDVKSLAADVFSSNFALSAVGKVDKLPEYSQIEKRLKNYVPN